MEHNHNKMFTSLTLNLFKMSTFPVSVLRSGLLVRDLVHDPSRYTLFETDESPESHNRYTQDTVPGKSFNLRRLF